MSRTCNVIVYCVFFTAISSVTSENVTLSCFKSYCFKSSMVSPIFPLDCGDELWPLELTDKESFEDFKKFWDYENNNSVLLNIWQFQSKTLFWDISAADLTDVQYFNYISDQYGSINNSGSIAIATEHDKKYFLCQYYLVDEICLKKDITIWKMGNHCFVLSETKETWIKARSECLERNGDLISFDENINSSSSLLGRLQGGCWIKFRNKAWIWIKSRAEVTLPGLRTMTSFKSSQNIVVLNPRDFSLHLDSCGSDNISVVCMKMKEIQFIKDPQNSSSVTMTAVSEVNVPGKNALRLKRATAAEDLVIKTKDMYNSTWGVEKHLYLSMSILAVVLAIAITLMENRAEKSITSIS